LTGSLFSLLFPDLACQPEKVRTRRVTDSFLFIRKEDFP
jgi:hypothetical protein